MTPQVRRLCLTAALSLGALVAAWPAAALTGGDLIKLPDDGNPVTQADSSVYYYGADNKRYVFPNAQTYFTWYADFAGVKTVSAAGMAAIPLGGNVTYRAGTRLVKITSDPKVYAVEPGGVLRPIDSEAVARAIFGDQWNQRIDDISDAYFVNYRSGEVLAAAVYPNGSFVRRASDGVYFLIENRTKRLLASASVRQALRLQDQFVLNTTGSLSDYPDGAGVANAEPTLTDTSQKIVVNVPSVPTFSRILPATSYVPVGGDATLLELRVGSLKAVTIRKLTVKIEATTGLDDDLDVSGLVYGNNAQPNLKLIRLVDASGYELMGRKEAALDVNQDDAQTFTFTGAMSVPAGTELAIYLKAQINSLLPTGQGYQAKLVMSGVEVADAATGALANAAPTTDLVGATLTTLNAAMELLPSAKPGFQTYVRGALQVDLGGLSFKATTVAPNVIKALTVQGFIDEEGTGGFLPGVDADNGTATRVRDMISQVSLHDSQGNKLAGPVEVTLDGTAEFTGLNYQISPGQTASLIIRGDLSATVDLESQPNKLAFDIFDPVSDITVVDDKGNHVNVTGALPNGGDEAIYYVTVREAGELKFSWSGNGGRVIAGQEGLLGTLSIESKYDSFAIKTLSFRQESGIAHSIVSARLAYPVGAQTVSVTKDFLGNSVTYANLPIAVGRDAKVDVKLYAPVLPRDAGAVYAEQLKVKFGGASDALEFVSQTSGEGYSEADLTGGFSIGSNSASGLTVRYSLLTGAKLASSPGTVYKDVPTEVMRFTFKAEPSGGVRVRKMVFKLSPGDAGLTGAANDALEVWARTNGDFPDDDNVATLKHVYPAGGTEVVGEDGNCSLKYSVVHAGNKITNPVGANYVSSGGDYALLEYAFNEGSEFSINAGLTYEYSLEVDTSAFASDKDNSFGIELVGVTDFLWTDIPSGAYTALSGNDAIGIPLSNSVTVKK